VLTRIGDDHARRFAEDGYFVLERALGAPELEMLQREADLAVAREDARIGRSAADVERITHAGQRYFVIHRSRERLELRNVLFSSLMLHVCARLVGRTAYLFTELFVCKRTGEQTEFGWHQDFGYVDHFGFGHYPPNVSVWFALDDMTERNGTLRVLPFSRGGTQSVVKHRQAPGGTDVVADFGDTSGSALLEMPAGSVVVMSGLLPHASGPNTAPSMRRSYLVQYSSVPILMDDGKPAQLAIPVLAEGAAQKPDYSGQPPRDDVTTIV
jgi:ectoine hydroxylase-related dioxygenase (phytanoyl-CoA dioxygenase family)